MSRQCTASASTYHNVCHLKIDKVQYIIQHLIMITLSLRQEDLTKSNEDINIKILHFIVH